MDRMDRTSLDFVRFQLLAAQPSQLEWMEGLVQAFESSKTASYI